MKKITSVSSCLFEDHLILSLSKDWLNVFKKIPSFEVMIDERNKLYFISKEEIQK